MCVADNISPPGNRLTLIWLPHLTLKEENVEKLILNSHFPDLTDVQRRSVWIYHSSLFLFTDRSYFSSLRGSFHQVAWVFGITKHIWRVVFQDILFILSLRSVPISWSLYKQQEKLSCFFKDMDNRVADQSGCNDLITVWRGSIRFPLPVRLSPRLPVWGHGWGYNHIN